MCCPFRKNACVAEGIDSVFGYLCGNGVCVSIYGTGELVEAQLVGIEAEDRKIAFVHVLAFRLVIGVAEGQGAGIKILVGIELISIAHKSGSTLDTVVIHL